MVMRKARKKAWKKIAFDRNQFCCPRGAEFDFQYREKCATKRMQVPMTKQ